MPFLEGVVGGRKGVRVSLLPRNVKHHFIAQRIVLRELTSGRGDHPTGIENNVQKVAESIL